MSLKLIDYYTVKENAVNLSQITDSVPHAETKK